MNSSLEVISAIPHERQPMYLLVMLHGWGANYQDFVPLAKLLNLPDFGYLFPNAPFPHFQVPDGRAWYALENNDFTGLTQSREILKDWLLSLEASTGIPLNRTVVAGFSQGGAMVLDVGLTLPFAAVCSFSGYLHYQPQSPTNKVFPPTMLIHGKQDPVVPLEAAVKAKEELGKIGVAVEYHALEMAHEVKDEAIALFKQFIAKHVQR